MMKQIQVIDGRKRNYGGIQVPNFATETAFEYKYQMATETAERNTSKRVSAKETALRNVYKYSRKDFFFFFFLNRSDFKQNGVEGVE